jgi:sugar O-acyltransferase (sialic acid O-acetyltransferase NeuD family)
VIQAEAARTAYIVGSGGHAHVIRSLLPHGRIRFLVDRAAGPDDLLQETFLASPDREGDYFIGIGDDAARRCYFDRLKEAELRQPPCIAPTAWVAADAAIGPGAFVGSGAILGARSRLGSGAIANTQVSIDHDCIVGDFSQLAPGVTLGGEVTIGGGCFLGMRACVLPRLEIGDGAFVMAGSLVVRSVAPGTRVGGSPARITTPGGAPPSGRTA